MTTTSVRPPFAAWVLGFAAVGFAAGFFGPILLNPEANQGPMLGIFITGPGGLVLGAAVGVVARWLQLSWSALIAVASLYGTVVLYFCLPGPAVVGDIFELETVSCHAPPEFVADAIDHWEQRIAAVTWHPPRDDWKEELRAAARTEGGKVMEAVLVAQHRILRHRKPWSFGRLTLERVHDGSPSGRFFVQAGCDDQSSAPRRYFASANQMGNGWPPVELPNLLNLRVLEPLPKRYAALIH